MMPYRCVWMYIVCFMTMSDSSPVCDESYAYIEVAEDAVVGTVVKEITCVHGYGGTGDEIAYAIKRGNTHGKFGMNTTNGIGKVFVYQPISFESRTTNFQLSIEISENSPSRTSTNFVLDIQVTGVNDYAPLFLFSPYTVYVNEDLRPGSVISNPLPYDFDKGDDGTTTCIILDGDDTFFYMDPKTAKVYLRSPLDFELQVDFVLTIQVTDNGLPVRRSSTTLLNIHVKDVNDNPPVCEEPYITETFDETKEAGSMLRFIKCSDADFGNNGRLSYTISDGDYTKFRLQGPTLVLLKQIDVDTESKIWPLSVLVRDRGNPRMSTTVDIVLYVEGVDDNAPIWAPPEFGKYVIDIEEHSAIGTHIVRISADDMDSSDASDTRDSVVVYYLDTYSTLFTIKPTTGDIFLSRELDREEGATYKLPVSAVSHNNPIDRISTDVIINVVDVNDNTPTFEKDVFQFFIAEDADTNTVVATVKAVDNDDGDNGDVQYRIIGGDPNSLFDINPATGQIALMGKLDYETTITHTVFLQSSDRGHPIRWSTCTVIVSVQPVNELEPIFKEMDVVNIAEDTAIGASVFQVHASDGDTGEDGIISYSMLSGTYTSTFAVEARTGVVRILNNLDREVLSDLKPVFLATDMSLTNRKTGSITVNVNIVDRNDNSPICEMFYSIVLSPPITSGDVIIELNCTDNDTGPNGKLTYTIIAGNTNNDLTMSFDGNLIVARKPTSAKYRIKIEVSDSGTPSLSTSVLAHIKTGSKPVFQNLPHTISISEGKSIGASIFKVEANSISEQLEFKINNILTPFPTSSDLEIVKIDEHTGEMYTWNSFDRERVDKYIVEVNVIDVVSGLETKGLLDIYILDANDHAPKFEKSLYNVSVIENINPVAQLIQVVADDPDLQENGFIDFAITAGNYDDVFAIDKNGFILIKSNVDRERTDLYHLVVTATDNGSPDKLTGSTTILITVLDSDEYSPEFMNAGYDLEISLREDTPLGANLILMEARDLDEGSELSYTIDDESKEHFIINNYNGQLFLSKLLDRETRDLYHVIVTVQGNDKVVTATVTVTVTDVNDNDPKFLLNVFTFNVFEKANRGDVVGILSVSDSDEGQNSLITMSITKGNVGNTFSINQKSILLIGDLNYDMINEFLLQVEARDQGSPIRTADVSVIVQVNPEYRIPKFSIDFQFIHLPENTHIGHLVYDVDATSLGAEEGNGGDLSYGIESGNDSGIFAINRQTGEIALSRKLDRDMNQHVFLLLIVARNIYDTNLKSEISLKIEIDDINDGSPAFEKDSYVFHVREDVTIHTVIDRLLATDTDSGQNAIISYELVDSEDSDMFNINTFTGDLLVKNKLDYVYLADYQFSVKAYDHGSPSLTGTAYVKVNVIDVNDKAPQFETENTTIRVRENTAIGRTVYQIRATDYDTGVGGEVLYRLVSGNDNGTFELDSENGHLRVAKQLDREFISTFVFIVDAEDKGSPSLTTTGSLTIIVTDINDNAPLFIEKLYSVSLSRFSPIESSLVTVSAIDADTGENGAIDYMIAPEHQNVFQINSKTGYIFTFSDLSTYGNSMELVVVAKDQGIPRLSSSVTVEIGLHPPVMHALEDYNFTVSEYASPNTFIGSVATSSETKYMIVSGNFKNSFRISETDGSIFLNSVVDREVYPDYVLLVRSILRLSPNIQSNIYVHVRVTDENDNHPIFGMESYSLNVLEHTPVGYSIAVITASDKDIGENGKLTYTITNGIVGNANAVFGIDENGTITMKKVILYQIDKHFNFSIIAKDNGQFSRHGSAQIDVRVVDTNEDKLYKPCTKDSRVISLEIPLFAQEGDIVSTLTPLMFGLNVSANKVGFLTHQSDIIFSIDKVTGDITLNKLTDLTEGVSFLFWVIAGVSRTPRSRSHSSMALVRIDTIPPNKHVVVLTHSVSKEILDLNRDVLSKRLQSIFPNDRPVIWMTQEEEFSFRRRLLYFSSNSKSFIYVIRENVTDSLEGIRTKKRYIQQDELIRVLGTGDGGVSERLTSEDFDSFPVVSVNRFQGPNKLDKPWERTLIGKVVIGAVLAGVVFLAIMLVVMLELKKNPTKKIGAVNLNIPPNSTQIEPKYNNIKTTAASAEALPLMNALKVLSNMSEEERNKLIQQTFNTKKSETPQFQTTILNVNKWKSCPAIHVTNTESPDVKAAKKVTNEKAKDKTKLFQVKVTKKPTKRFHTPDTSSIASTTSSNDIESDLEKKHAGLLRPINHKISDNASVSSLELDSVDTVDETASESNVIVKTQSGHAQYDNTSPTRATKRSIAENRPIIIGGKEYDGVGKDTASNRKYLYNTMTGDKLHVTDDILKRAIEHRQSVIESKFNDETREAKLSTFKKPMRRKTSRTRFSTTTIWEMSVDAENGLNKSKGMGPKEGSDECLKRRRQGVDNSVDTYLDPPELLSQERHHSGVSDVSEIGTRDTNTISVNDDNLTQGNKPQRHYQSDSDDNSEVFEQEKQVSCKREMPEDTELTRRVSANASWDKLISSACGKGDDTTEENEDDNNAVFKTLPAILENDNNDKATQRWTKAKKIVKFVRPVYKPLNLEHVKCKVPKGKSDPKDCLSKDPVYAGWAKMVGRRIKSKVVRKPGEEPRTVTIRQGRSLPAGIPMTMSKSQDVSPYAKVFTSKLPPHLTSKRMSIDINIQ